MLGKILKTMFVLLFFSFTICSLNCCADKKEERVVLEPGCYAVFHTSLGNITCLLYEKETPVTTAYFIGLAEGTKEWIDPKTGNKEKRRFYDGLIFHRVIPGFMIQGGDPKGDGTGGPGYKFKDEFNPDLNFDCPGRLAMANAGPDTNGSQFFITHKPTPWLNHRHTIFGQVVEGQGVVDKIGRVKTAAGNRPRENVIIQKLEIIRIDEKREKSGSR